MSRQQSVGALAGRGLRPGVRKKRTGLPEHRPGIWIWCSARLCFGDRLIFAVFFGRRYADERARWCLSIMAYSLSASAEKLEQPAPHRSLPIG